MKVLIIFTISCISLMVNAQEKKAGPVINDFGKVWQIAEPSYPTPTDIEYKVVFDIMYSPDDPSRPNASIETAARFLNMHAQSGVPVEKMKVALVVHNKASKELCTNDAYQNRYGVKNPNAAMIASLLSAGTEIIFCGQSSVSRNFPIDQTIKGVKLSLSAMTALIDLQNKGYHLIKF